MADLPARPVGPFLEQLRQPIANITRPKVVLVAWGGTPADAAAALVRGGKYAEEYHFNVIETIASFCPVVRGALLYGKTDAGYVRRERCYDAAWWLLRHDCVTRADLDAARRAQRRMEPEIDEEYADAFKHEYGYPPDAVTLGREGDEFYRYPFTDVPAVEDRRVGRLPVGGPGRSLPGASGQPGS
jgi:hypothetical protein